MEGDGLSKSWEIAKIVSTILATILVPISLGIVGNIFAKITKDREVSAKYVELAIGILKTKLGETPGGLREWAVDVIDHYSMVKLPKGVKEYLKLEKLFTVQNLINEQNAEIKATADAIKTVHDKVKQSISEVR